MTIIVEVDGGTHPLTGGGALVGMDEVPPRFSPAPQPGLTHSLQVVRTQGQFSRGRRHSAEKARQQRVEQAGEHPGERYIPSL